MYMSDASYGIIDIETTIPTDTAFITTITTELSTFHNRVSALINSDLYDTQFRCACTEMLSTDPWIVWIKSLNNIQSAS